MKSNSEQLTTAINQVEQSITPQQQAKLDQIRSATMQQAGQGTSPWYIGSGVAASCALVLALWLPLSNPSSTLDQPMVADKDLVENLEFYTWLAEQPAE